MKLKIYTSFLFFAIGSFELLAQTTTNETVSEQQIVKLAYSQEEKNAVYSFTPLTEFDEFKSIQRVKRINDLTGDTAIVELKRGKVCIRLNPSLTNGQNLEKLLLVIVRIHGYSTYTLDN